MVHSLWDLFSADANRLEKTWNISQRIMLGIPRNTHPFFIEPLTETQHIKFSLLKRFVTFVDSIESSTKLVLRNMLEIVSTTADPLQVVTFEIVSTTADPQQVVTFEIVSTTADPQQVVTFEIVSTTADLQQVVTLKKSCCYLCNVMSMKYQKLTSRIKFIILPHRARNGWFDLEVECLDAAEFDEILHHILT